MYRYLFLFILPFVTAKFRFDNYTLYKITPKNVDQVKVLQELQEDLRFDFWKEPTVADEFVNILVSPENKGDLESLLKGKNVAFDITMSNIQE